MKLVEDRSLVPSAIEETLRWKNPRRARFSADCEAVTLILVNTTFALVTSYT